MRISRNDECDISAKLKDISNATNKNILEISMRFSGSQKVNMKIVERFPFFQKFNHLNMSYSFLCHLDKGFFCFLLK